jgi:hypothetical protein
MARRTLLTVAERNAIRRKRAEKSRWSNQTLHVWAQGKFTANVSLAAVMKTVNSQLEDESSPNAKRAPRGMSSYQPLVSGSKRAEFSTGAVPQKKRGTSFESDSGGDFGAQGPAKKRAVPVSAYDEEKSSYLSQEDEYEFDDAPTPQVDLRARADMHIERRLERLERDREKDKTALASLGIKMPMLRHCENILLTLLSPRNDTIPLNIRRTSSE